MCESTVTFVTAFLDLVEDRSKDKSPTKCFEHFKSLAASGISIALFVSKSLKEQTSLLIAEFPNVKLIDTIELNQTWTYNILSNTQKLPNNRTEHHDTFNFLALMNAKIEFVNYIVHLNPFNTSHFAWIDFSICHVIRQPDITLSRLATYSKSMLKTPMLLFPGCWNKQPSDRNFTDQIIWRFCGGFFIGDSSSIKKMYEYTIEQLPIFTITTGKTTWETNFWAWLESNTDWSPEWFNAGHNDTMLLIPSKYICTVASFTTIPPRVQSCKAAIDSLISQVDHIYLNVSRTYERFGEFVVPEYLNTEPYCSHVTVNYCDDYGPATKYLGALQVINQNTWIFFCDDDQEYKSDLINNMKHSIIQMGAYQNRYDIVKNGSGGIIHGYVGNMCHRSLLNNLSAFPLPNCARHVDDQWMSIYFYMHNIPIFKTFIERYSDIFHKLQNGYEQIGIASLASLGTRDAKVAELAQYFKIEFIADGQIQKCADINK